ncbi:MAG TPA: tetratricopeptide repeat protein [Anaerolineae bacterium]|nr:tetratricopeptide repeat protein [Anaerolineae bacterium]HQI83396.1 tetratricopeptide repeat protein [Anaerolineae bacterium]
MMTHKASPAPAYTQRSLELRAAEYYASIRKPQSDWKSIEDLTPQLAEFEHLTHAKKYDSAARVLRKIDFNYLDLWGYHAYLAAMREKLLGHITDVGAQAYNFGSLGRIYHILGETGQAIDLYEQALTIVRRMNNRRWESAWLGNLGHASYDLGRIQWAQDQLTRAVILAQEARNHQGEATWLNYLANVYRALGELRQAVAYYEQALNIVGEISDRRRECLIFSDLARAYYSLGQAEQIVSCCEKGLIIAREIGYHYGESCCLVGLAKGSLLLGDFYRVQQCCTESLVLGYPESNYQAALLWGIGLLHQQDLCARNVFVDAITHCLVVLDKTEDMFEVRYLLALALVGQAVCAPYWPDLSQRTVLLAPALTEYRHALNITAAPGVVSNALRDLELIRAAGIEGLEPVFDLLEGALHEQF